MLRNGCLWLVGLVMSISTLGCMTMASAPEEVVRTVEATRVNEPEAGEPVEETKPTSVPESPLQPLPTPTAQIEKTPQAEYASAYEKRRIILDWPGKL